jgi:4-oxalocrotonate tautomerase
MERQGAVVDQGWHFTKGRDMPLVRISLMKGKPEGFGGKIGELVYRSMVDVMNVPAKDNFQVITEHDQDSLVYDPGYLDIARTDGIVIVQITLNEGRTVEVKKAFYKTLAERLDVNWGSAWRTCL